MKPRYRMTIINNPKGIVDWVRKHWKSGYIHNLFEAILFSPIDRSINIKDSGITCRIISFGYNDEYFCIALKVN